MEDVLYYTKKSRVVVSGISPINTAAMGRGPPRKCGYACSRTRIVRAPARGGGDAEQQTGDERGVQPPFFT